MYTLVFSRKAEKFIKGLEKGYREKLKENCSTIDAFPWKAYQ